MDKQPKVNLLDCEYEPSDEQLESLMVAVASDVRARAEIANTALVVTINKAVETARERYNLSCRQPTAKQ